MILLKRASIISRDTLYYKETKTQKGNTFIFSKDFSRQKVTEKLVTANITTSSLYEHFNTSDFLSIDKNTILLKKKNN